MTGRYGRHAACVPSDPIWHSARFSSPLEPTERVGQVVLIAQPGGFLNLLSCLLVQAIGFVLDISPCEQARTPATKSSVTCPLGVPARRLPERQAGTPAGTMENGFDWVRFPTLQFSFFHRFNNLRRIELGSFQIFTFCTTLPSCARQTSSSARSCNWQEHPA
jgi:hypothetical protein